MRLARFQLGPEQVFALWISDHRNPQLLWMKRPMRRNHGLVKRKFRLRENLWISIPQSVDNFRIGGPRETPLVE